MRKKLPDIDTSDNVSIPLHWEVQGYIPKPTMEEQKIGSLEQKNNALKQKNTALESKIKELEQKLALTGQKLD